jgi:hypothetical protein
VIVAVSAVAGCRRAAPPRAVEPEPVADAAPYAVARPAIRCAECHGKMHEEWRGSAHARADLSELYQAMRARAPEPSGCDRCHAPLRPFLEPGDRVAAEGVTCEVCHTIHEVDERRGGFAMSLDTNVARGPICDAKDHYFHKMGCSPLHAESRFCAACHVLRLGDVPVFTDYEEWQEGPYADLYDCQDCHMPVSAAEVAEGSPPRDGVSHHAFLGPEAPFKRALAGSLEVIRGDGVLRVEVRVRNANAAHRVPGGLPGRQILVRAIALDARGAELARRELIYERLLVDASGRPVPFYAAAREEQDSRLAPKEDRLERFELEAPEAARVRLEVVRRELAPELARAIDLLPVPEEVLVTVEAPPGAGVDWRQ